MSSSCSSKSFHNPIVADSRFGHVHTDPRFRRKPKEEKTFRVDPRFQRMFTDKAFQINADVVDKWGRRQSTQRQDPLKKLYRLDDEDKQDESDDEIVFDEPGKKGKEDKKKSTKSASAIKPSKSTSSPSLTSTSTAKSKKSTSSASPSLTSTSSSKSKKSSSTSSSSLTSTSAPKPKKSSSTSPSLQPSASKKTASSSPSLTSSKSKKSSSSPSLSSSKSSKSSYPDFPDFILSDDAADESDSDYTPPKDDLEGDEDDDAAVAMDIRGFNDDGNEDENAPMGLPSDDEDEEEVPKVRNPKLMKLLAESGGMDDDDEDEQDDDKDKDDEDDDERDIGNAIYEGFSTSSDEEFDDIDPNDIAELAPVEEENIPEGEPSRRIAIMNMEWDRVKAQDLYVLLRSFLPNAAGLQSVHIYPSEYGKKRMAEESKYGPLGLYNLEEAEQKKRELDAKIAAIKVEFHSDDEVDSDKAKGKKNEKKSENKEDDKKEKKQDKKKGKPQDQEEAPVDEEQGNEDDDVEADDDDDDDDDDDTNAASFQHDEDETEVTDANAVDMEALRKYELDRLRYYYAIVVCDTITNAEHLYKECDGLEFESSSNVMDLRFVPDDVTFDEEPRDECDTMPTSYKAPSFYTKALQQSRVELTWDRDDPNRVQVLNKKFTKEDEMDDDIKAYLGSDDDEDGNGSDAVISATDSEDSDAVSDDEHKKKVILKKRARNKFAALLDELKVDKDANAPSMEIVFESGLKEVGEKILKDVQAKKAQAEETTWEKYLRERKEKRKAKKKARKEGIKVESKDKEESLYSDDDIPQDMDDDDPFFKDAFDGEEYKKPEKDDDAPKKDKPKKEKKKKKKREEETEEEKERKERERAELELIMMPEAENVQTSNRVGYDLKALVRQEKEKGQKKKKKRGQEETLTSTDDFTVDTSDPRFAHLYHDPAYAIDPTNPSFKPTAGTQQLLKEKQKRRAQQMQQEEEQVRQRKKQRQADVAITNNNNTETSASSSSSSSSSSLASLVASVKRMSKQHNEKMEGKR